MTSKRIGDFFKNQNMIVFCTVFLAPFLTGYLPFWGHYLLPGYLYVKLTLLAICLSSLKKCNLCHSTEAEFLFTKNSFDIVRCKKCGLVYVQRQPTDEEIRALYETDFFEGRNQLGSYSAYLKEIDNITKNSKKQLKQIEQYKKRGKLLDVGCAAGFFLDVAGTKWETTGVELSESMSHYARDVLGLNVINGKFIDIDLPPRSFDVITMWDFIDHTRDPKGNLSQAWKLLRERGLLALSACNVGHWLARVRGVHWRLFSPPVHLYYFSIRTMRAMLEKVGFDVLKIFTGKRHKSLESILFTLACGSKQKIWNYAHSLIKDSFLGHLSISISLGDTMTILAMKRRKIQKDRRSGLFGSISIVRERGSG